MSELRTAPFEPARREELFRLLADVWGEAPPSEEFDWWFGGGAPRPEPILSVAEENGRLAGVSAISFFPMRVGGERVPVAIPLYAATHPDFRGRGIFQRLELENEARARTFGSAVGIGFTNPMAGPILVGRMGWNDLPQLRLWARPLRPVSAVRALRGRGGAKGGGLRATSTAPRRLEGVEVQMIERFGAAEAAVAERAAATWPSHVVRDEAFLNWRYVDSPRAYRCFVALHKGRVRGYAVVGHTIHHGVSTGFVADLAVEPRAFVVTRALLRRCIEEVRGGADVLTAIPPPTRSQRLAFGSLAFVPTPMTIRLIGKALEADVRLPERWHFALGDTDFF